MTIIAGTNPSILIDYNDGLPMDRQINAMNSVYSFNHTYTNGGYFDMNITVFNLVSSVSKIIRVI